METSPTTMNERNSGEKRLLCRGIRSWKGLVVLLKKVFLHAKERPAENAVEATDLLIEQLEPGLRR